MKRVFGFCVKSENFEKGVVLDMKNKKLKYIIILVLVLGIVYLKISDLKVRQAQNEIQEISHGIMEDIQETTNVTVESSDIVDIKENIDQIEEVLVKNEKVIKLIEKFENEDIVGYLSIEDTSISYPVLQSVDNEFYLKYDAYKKESKAGSIYLDYENDIEKLDYNTVIYGHNMKEKIMFHDLRYYKEEEFYKNHKYIEFTTLYNEYVYEIFSVYETGVEFPYINVLFQSEEDFFKLSSEFKEKSIYDTGIDISKTDKVITLSTCSYFTLNQNKRLVVQGKLIEVNGESYK